tara:strand:- start:283 stop:603 length:321 start_codon:yes stop_codon:yes gene_type:complete
MNNAIAQMLSGRAPAQRPQQNAIGNAVPQQMKAAMPRPQMPRPQMPGPQMPGPQMPNMAQGMQNQMQPPTQPGKPQAVRGRDGQMYSIVIDPTTGLQTFSPYQGGM